MEPKRNSSATKLNFQVCAATLSLALFLSSATNLAAQNAWGGCGPSQTTHQVLGHAGSLLHGIKEVPRNAIRPENLKWELPIAATTGLLIAEIDQPAANRIQSNSFQNLAGRWSDAGLITQIGAGAAMWGVGCIQHRRSLRDNGLTALTAMAAAGRLI